MITRGGGLSKTERYPWVLLGLLCGAYFLHQADRAIFGVVLPLIKADLRLSDTQVGGIATVLFAVITILVPLAGPLADRLSRKALVAGSLIFWSLSTMLTGLASGLTSLTLLRGVATGGGEALYTPAAYSLISGHHAERRGLALSIHQMALYVGLIASGAVGGYVAEIYGWRATFYVFGAAGVLLGLFMAYRLKPDPRHKGTTGSTPRSSVASVIRQFFSNPASILLSLAFGCYMIVTNAYLVWGPELFHEKFGLGVGAAGTISMVAHHSTAILGVLFGGWLSDRHAREYPPSRILLQSVALGVAAPFILLMAAANTLLLSCGAVALFGLFREIYDSNIQASLFEIVPEADRGTAWSLMVLIGFLIGSASPLITGWLKQEIGGVDALSTIFGAYCMIYILAAVFLLIALQILRPRFSIRRAQQPQ